MSDVAGFTLAQLSLAVAGGGVKRYHTHRVLKEQTVAEHSYEVAWLCALIMGPETSVALLRAALMHDIEEHVTGDIPAPTKLRQGMRDIVAEHEAEVLAAHHLVYPELDTLETRVLSLADAFDGLLYCVRERHMGNRGLAEVEAKYVDYSVKKMGDLAWEFNVGYPTIVLRARIVFNHLLSESGRL